MLCICVSIVVAMRKLDIEKLIDNTATRHIGLGRVHIQRLDVTFDTTSIDSVH